MTEIAITERLTHIRVDHAAGMVVMTFALRQPNQPPYEIAIPKDAATQLAVGLISALTPQQTIAGGERLRMGFELEAMEVGTIGDGRVSLGLTILQNCLLSFVCDPQMATRMGEGLLSSAAAEIQTPPPGAKAN